MGRFLTGVVVGAAGLAAGAYIYVHYGFMNMRAAQPTGRIERKYMSGAMDRYLARYAVKVSNPLPASDSNLIDGIQLYKDNCAGCHGGAEKPISVVGESLNPAAPQFLKDPPDMPDNENFWVIKYGVKMTGMPAWNNVLADNDIWKITAFLSKMDDLDKLSPAVQTAWKVEGQPVPEPAPTPSETQPNPPSPSTQHGHIRRRR